MGDEIGAIAQIALVLSAVVAPVVVAIRALAGDGSATPSAAGGWPRGVQEPEPPTWVAPLDATPLHATPPAGAPLGRRPLATAR